MGDAEGVGTGTGTGCIGAEEGGTLVEEAGPPVRIQRGSVVGDRLRKLSMNRGDEYRAAGGNYSDWSTSLLLLVGPCSATSPTINSHLR